MADVEDKSNRELVVMLNDVNEKIISVASILEKFGFDIITNLGKTTFSVNVLSDKIDELHKATIDIKSLSPQLNNIINKNKKIIENQKYLESELNLIKSLVQESKFNHSSNSVEIDGQNNSSIDNKQMILDQFTAIFRDIEDMKEPQAVIKALNKVKEDIFEYTGGHRILYEISKSISDLSNINELSPKTKDLVKEKCLFWKNKIK